MVIITIIIIIPTQKKFLESNYKQNIYIYIYIYIYMTRNQCVYVLHSQNETKKAKFF